MKVALLGDVHANLAALEAVLADARTAAAEAVWNLGDFVGYGPCPEEVIRRLRAEGAVSILGNYDRKVLDFPRNKDRWRRQKLPEKYLAFRWAYENLTADSRAYLASLPEQLRLEAAGCRVLLVHGSPAAIDDALGPDTPPERLAALAAGAAADLVACGHSHQPFARQVGGVWFVNPGSVGRPEGDDPRASYALLDLRDGRPEVEHRRIEYDVEATARLIRSLGLPGDFGEMLVRGRSLDGVRAAAGAARGTPPPPCRRKQDAACLEAVIALAGRCEYEQEHTHQVTRLALALFDQLRPLHGMGDDERFWLQCGAMLHDVGWCQGRRAHHKTAQRIILQAANLPLPSRGRAIVALIARYHRKGLPSLEHPPFAALDPADRRRVRVLGGILRLADGLDRSHLSLVRGVACEIEPDRIVIHGKTVGPARPEEWAAARKSNLLETAFAREVIIDLDERDG